MRRSVAALMGWLIVLIPEFVAVAQQRPTPMPPIQAVHYTLSPIREDNRFKALRVAIDFNVGAKGSMLVRLPWRYAGRDDLFANVSDIVVSGGELTDTARAPEKLVTAAPGTHVALSYVLRSGIDHEPTIADEQPFTPWILKDWIFLDGASVFPRLEAGPTIPATFEWTGDPSIPFASDLTRFRVPLDGGSVGDVIGGTILAGEGVRILDLGPVRLAVRGDTPFEDHQILDVVASLVRELREFWGDPQDDPFLVNLVALASDDLVSYAGTGHGSDAFAAVTFGEVRYRDLVGSLFAHEIMHGWIPGQLSLRAASDDTWFGEGFTEYYARLIPLRAGVISIDDFVARWNEALVDYALSPARNWTQTRLEEAHWIDKNAELMPYNKGAMLAALWNARLRQVSDGKVDLDDLLRRQRMQARDAIGSRPSDAVGAVSLLADNARKAGFDIASDIVRHVIQGDTLVLPADTFGPCLIVGTVAIANYDLGFDLEASLSAGRVAVGVRAGGPAYKSGLRDGMRLVRRVAGRIGDPTLDTAWIVHADGRERTIRWKPAGQDEVMAQQLRRVVDTPEDAVACGL